MSEMVIHVGRRHFITMDRQNPFQVRFSRFAASFALSIRLLPTLMNDEGSDFCWGLMVGLGKRFSALLWGLYEKLDLYAGAIWIKVRSVFVVRIFYRRELSPVCAEGAMDLRLLSGSYGVSAERLLLFLLGCLLCLLSLLCFLGHVALRDP